MEATILYTKIEMDLKRFLIKNSMAHLIKEGFHIDWKMLDVMHPSVIGTDGNHIGPISYLESILGQFSESQLSLLLAGYNTREIPITKYNDYFFRSILILLTPKSEMAEFTKEIVANTVGDFDEDEIKQLEDFVYYQALKIKKRLDGNIWLVRKVKEVTTLLEDKYGR